WSRPGREVSSDPLDVSIEKGVGALELVASSSKKEKPEKSNMTDSIMSKAATMEIPINSNGDTGNLPEDDGLEQAAQIQWSLDEKVGNPRLP
ncbi:hypothetical protein JZ751_002190, partial [Albula glossodonta]